MTFNCELSKNIPEVLKNRVPRYGLLMILNIYLLKKKIVYNSLKLQRFEFKFSTINIKLNLKKFKISLSQTMF